MKRKYKIFISSSFVDLKEIRERLHFKTLKLGHIPAGMELFQPGEAHNLEVIEQEIASSDIFVILVGARLGTQVTDDDPMTFIMREFELAKKCKLPVIAFLLDKVEFKKERDAIPSDRQSEREQEPLIRQFRENVQFRSDGKKRLVEFFSYQKIDHLCDQYSDAIRNELDRRSSSGREYGGWVEGTAYDDLLKHYEEQSAHIVLGESASNNEFFRNFAKRLSTFEKLSNRTAIESPSKLAIAEYFWEQYMPRIHEKEIRSIYFESGSSIAYVSRSFIDYVREEEWFYERGMDTRLTLRTNNILTYLEFLLVAPPWRPMDIQLLPHGPFSGDYGATYGKLKSTVKISSPRNSNEARRIPADAAKQVAALTAELSQLFDNSGLILMTTSGIDINPDSAHPGPHVGSPYNMLLKRCLLSLSCPKVMFLDEKKWNYPFGYNKCHSICDSDFPWNNVKKNSPLAIALAVKNKTARENLSQSLADNGFVLQEKGEVLLGEEKEWPVIAANKSFTDFFG